MSTNSLAQVTDEFRAWQRYHRGWHSVSADRLTQVAVWLDDGGWRAYMIDLREPVTSLGWSAGTPCEAVRGLVEDGGHIVNDDAHAMLRPFLLHRGAA